MKMKMNLKQVVLGMALVATTSLSSVAQCKQQIWPDDEAKALADGDQEQPLEKTAETPAEQPVDVLSSAPAESTGPSNENGD